MVDEHGSPVTWPQTPTNLTTVSRNMAGFAAELPWLFIRDHGFLLKYETAFVKFFASQDPELLQHYSHVIVNSSFSEMDWHDRRFARYQSAALNNVIGFVGELSPNVEFTVEVYQPAASEDNSNVITEDNAIVSFAEYLESIGHYIGDTPDNPHRRTVSTSPSTLACTNCSACTTVLCRARAPARPPTETPELALPWSAWPTTSALDDSWWPSSPSSSSDPVRGSRRPTTKVAGTETAWSCTRSRASVTERSPAARCAKYMNITRSKCRPYDAKGTIPQDRSCYTVEDEMDVDE